MNYTMYRQRSRRRKRIYDANEFEGVIVFRYRFLRTISSFVAHSPGLARILYTVLSIFADLERNHVLHSRSVPSNPSRNDCAKSPLPPPPALEGPKAAKCCA